jgi:hypothetical protein
MRKNGGKPMAKTKKNKRLVSTEHRCRTCGRKLEKLLLKAKKVEALQEKLSELRVKLQEKGQEHKKASRWSRRVERIERRLLGHTAASAVLS